MKEQLAALRVGSLSVDSLGVLKVRVYGGEMTLREVANLVSLDPSEVVIEPWDKSIVKDLEESLFALPNPGFSVVSDTGKIRLKASNLTQEKRDDLVREIGRKKEECRVAIRLVRQDEMRSLDEMEENGEISEDEKFRQREEVEKMMKQYNEEIESLAETKQKQVSSI